MTDNEDIKAKMREALDRKRPHDSAEGHEEHRKQKSPETRGPASADKQFRRKAGP